MALDDNSKIYHSQTGEKISYQQLVRLGQFVLKPSVDQYGDITSYLYLADAKPGLTKIRNADDRVEVGSPCLPFVMRDVDKNSVSLSDLQGKVVLLHFELSTSLPFFDTIGFARYENLLATFNDNEVFSISIFPDKPKSITARASNDLHDALIPFGQNFFDRYQITTFPTTILLDMEGHLVGYYEGPFLDELKSAISTLLN